MGLFTGIGDFFRGVFGEDDDERRRRKQREAREANARRQTAQSFRQNQGRGVNQFFGGNRQQQIDQPQKPKPAERPPKPLFQQQPAPIQPKPQAPRVNVPNPAEIRQKAIDYYKPKVQDVNNYYGNDLAVLKRELDKGDKTDYMRVQGIMQSLDNRQKELREFHKARGDSQSFKSARELGKRIKETRGNWDEKKQKLQQFWDSVSANEKQDFLEYLGERDSTPDRSQMAPRTANRRWLNGNGQNFTDFTPDAQEVKRIKDRQTIADIAREKEDLPLDQLNNKTIAQYRREFATQSPDQQRNTMNMLRKYMNDIGDNPSGDKNLERKLQQAYILYNVLDDDGTQRSNFGTRIQDLGAGAKMVGSALLESPERVIQSIGALAGDDPGGDIFEDYQKGKIDAAEYNRRMNEYRRKNKWAVDADTTKEKLLTATGTAADTVATFFPLGSAYKGARIAKGALEAAPRTLRRTMAEESAINAALSGAGSLRTGEFDPEQAFKETATGAVIGGVAPAAGNKAMQLWRRLRGIDTAAPEALEDVGRATSRVESPVRSQTPEADVARIQELRKVVDDIETPAFQKTAAREELAALERQADENAAAALGVGESPLDRPTFQHNQDMQRVINEEEAKLNRYLNEHPDLTPQQIEAARAAAKERVVKLTADLQANRAVNEAAVTAQGDELAATQEGLQATNAAVAAERAAQTTPSPANIVEGQPAAPNPEVAANDAYAAQSTDEILYGNAPNYEGREGLAWSQKLSPDRVIREKITRPVANKIDEVVQNLQRSERKVGRGIGRFFTGFSREAGVTPEQQTARMELRGGVETGKMNREAIADLSKGFNDESLDQVWATLDPEFAARKGFQGRALSPEETALQGKLKTIIDNTTAENLRRGLITPEQAANESYIKRSYSVYDGNEEAGKFEKGFRTELLNQYKGRKVVSDEMVDKAITDPTYLVGKKTAESEAMWAMQDYGNFLVKNGDVSDVARAGYTKLPDSPIFGEASGKYVPRNVAEDFTGFQYNNAMISAWNDLITTYDRWGIRQAKKQLLTVFNPAVRLGNQTTNRVIFANLNGINPVTFNIAYARVGKEIAENSPLYREAVQQGLTGVDITQAEFFAQRVAQAGSRDVNMGKKALDWVKTSYSDADDRARVAAYSVHRQRGYSPEEAARMTQRGFQDYKSVGFFYDQAAKTPFIGNAFVRFAADSVRIAKNSAIDHPLRSMATVALWSTMVNGMSVLSGESELKGDNVAEQAFNLVTGKSKSAEQIERESRFGAPKIPFTDISATVLTPWGEVNVARFMPWYQLNEISSTQIARFLPYAAPPIEVVDGKVRVNAPGFQDPLLGQLVQLGVDRDFRNKSIRDPEQNPNAPDMFRDAPLPGKDQRNNVLRFLGVGNAPLGKEIDAIASSLMGKEDLYGKERSFPQAVARALGFKVEQQGLEQREKRQGQAEYYAELEEIEKEVEKMSPAAQEAYKRLTGYYKLREEVPNEFSPGDMRKKKSPQYEFGEDKWKELAAHPELYELLMNKKIRASQKANKQGIKPPLQPEFDPRLSDGFRKQLIQNKMVAPGDDAELDQRMYSAPEWDYYQKLKEEYKKQAKKYYPQSDEEFTDELVKHQDAKFPEKPAILKQYGEAYGRYADGKGAKPEFTDAVKAAKEAYNKKTLDWTNTERRARGLPAIDWDTWNNPTFGFDSTPSGSGFGFGYGGGGSKYDPSLHVNTLGKLSNFTADVNGLPQLEPQAIPNIVQIFQKLQAGGGGRRSKPKLGAGSSGR